MLLIIDYGSGNLRSVAKAFERVAKNLPVNVSRDAKKLNQASHIVLPGVGAFADCMAGLKKLDGMIEALQEQVLTRGKNFLGICVGMQMLFERGHEHGVHEGLGWLKGEVVPLSVECGVSSVEKKTTLHTLHSTFKIPHMGWNTLSIVGDHPVVKNIHAGDHTYFVHSYHAKADAADILATTDYGQTIAAIVAKGNIMGTQFHPEKSQTTGLTLLENFCTL